MITFYHQTKISINFWCRSGLNLKSFIQPSKTLPVDLIGIHIIWKFLDTILRCCSLDFTS